jgi:adenosylcobinamide-phosphate synthase
VISPGLAVFVAVVAAAGLEAAVGEPPEDSHPVALLGRLIAWLEPRRFGVPRLAGTAYALAVPLGCALAGYAAVWLAMSTDVRLAAALAAGVVLWITTSVRMLAESGTRVIEASDGNLETARAALLALVGRETAELSPGLIRSAAVESLAENLSDGFLAPLLAFVLLSFVSLPAAAAGAAFVKGVNTMDSMLGYPGPFGWASARLDDTVMFVPSRLSAVLLGLAAGDLVASLRARQDAHTPASPNAGWPIGTIAAALNVRLQKPGAYSLNNDADLPTIADGRAAIRVTRGGAAVAYATAALVGVIRWA